MRRYPPDRVQHDFDEQKMHKGQSILLVVNTGLLLACLNYAVTIEHRLTALETAERVRKEKVLHTCPKPCIVVPLRRIAQSTPLRFVSLPPRPGIDSVPGRLFIPANRATIAHNELRRA